MSRRNRVVQADVHLVHAQECQALGLVERHQHSRPSSAKRSTSNSTSAVSNAVAVVTHFRLTIQRDVPNPRLTERPLAALATRLSLIHEEARTARRPGVLTDEGG